MFVVCLMKATLQHKALCGTHVAVIERDCISSFDLQEQRLENFNALLLWLKVWILILEYQ